MVITCYAQTNRAATARALRSTRTMRRQARLRGWATPDRDEIAFGDRVLTGVDESRNEATRVLSHRAMASINTPAYPPQ